MPKDWRQLKKEIEEETRRIWLEEPEELRKLRLGIIDNEAGSYGQYFTTWDFANGMIRDYSMYTLYPILKLAQDERFTLEHLKAMFRVFDPPYSVYLGYSGFRTLEKFAAEFIQTFESIKSKEDFIEIFKSFIRYANKLAAWSFHYFPWGIGVLFPHERAKEIMKLLSRTK
jgi:hypothetical protein